MALSECGGGFARSGRELASHGTTQFPIACYLDDLREGGVPWHWHEELEAGVVSQGRALVCIEDRTLTLETGDGFFVNSGALHAVEGGGCILHSLVFHPRLIGGGVDSVFWQKYLQPLVSDGGLKGLELRRAVSWQAQALSEIESAWEACRDEPRGFEFLVRNRLSLLTEGIIANSLGGASGPSPKISRDFERLKVMLGYISGHYGEDLSAAGIAASAAISESECLRCFRAAIGITPVKYLRQFRLQRAAELFDSTDMRISEVGEACGFRDMSYFAREFRRFKGLSPTAYRAKSPARAGTQSRAL